MDMGRPTTPLRRSLAIQARVVFALLMREIITRYGRHNIGFLWLFVEPMLFTGGVVAAWTLIRLYISNSHRELPVITFALTGYASLLLWRNTASRCMVAITPNLSLMYHRNVRAIDIFASRIILEIAGASISFLALTLAFTALGLAEPPVDPLQALHGWVMLSWFSAGLGLTLGGLSELSDFTEKVWHPLSYLLFPLSGLAFMVYWLPQAYHELVLWVPMVNALEMIRGGFFGPAVPTDYHIDYLAAFCLGLTFLGLAAVRIVGRHVQPE